MNGCAGDGPATTGASSAFDVIQEQIFNPNCLSGGCHNAQSRAGNMNLSPGASYDEIVGQLADNPAARADGFHFLALDVRASQDAAIHLYESLGFERWGENPNYALVEGKVVAGYYYTKKLRGGRTRKGKSG